MLNVKDINKFQDNFLKDKKNIIRHRMVNNVKLVDLIQDADMKDNNNFSIDIKTHGITDQKNTGYCWAFAGLNILREEVIKNLNLGSFEFSISYIAYYEKLERFNTLLERLIAFNKEGKDVYDREVETYLLDGLLDSGITTGLGDIINKYGLVPKTVFPDTFATTNSAEVRLILSRLIRKFYIELEKDNGNPEALKNKYLEQAYQVVTTFYGVPPKKFNYEYTTEKGEYHIIKDITPLDFYKEYVKIDLKKDYVIITSYHDKKYQFNKVYEAVDSTKVIGAPDYQVLNLKRDDFEELINKQILNKECVNIDAFTNVGSPTGSYIDTLERFGEIFDLDLVINCNDMLKTNEYCGTHALTVTGANVIDDKITKYKIENSYGPKSGINGYYVATPNWFNKYVFRAMVNKKYLSKEQLNILDQEPVKYDYIDIKF